MLLSITDFFSMSKPREQTTTSLFKFGTEISLSPMTLLERSNCHFSISLKIAFWPKNQLTWTRNTSANILKSNSRRWTILIRSSRSTLRTMTASRLKPTTLKANLQAEWDLVLTSLQAIWLKQIQWVVEDQSQTTLHFWASQLEDLVSPWIHSQC